MADLEIPGVHDQAERRPDSDPDPVHHAVPDPDEFEHERPQLQLLARMNFVQAAGRVDVGLLEFVPDDSQGEGRAENRRIDLFQQKRQGPDVVLVGVGQDDSGYQRAVSFDVVHVRDDEIDPEHVILRKHQAGIDEEKGRAVLENHHVEADLAETAQGYDL